MPAAGSRTDEGGREGGTMVNEVSEAASPRSVHSRGTTSDPAWVGTTDQHARENGHTTMQRQNVLSNARGVNAKRNKRTHDIAASERGVDVHLKDDDSAQYRLRLRPRIGRIYDQPASSRKRSNKRIGFPSSTRLKSDLSAQNREDYVTSRTAQKLDRWNFTGNRTHSGFDETCERDWNGPFYFAQLADTQFGMLNSNVDWKEDMELSRQAVQSINRLKPKFAIVCGDLVDMFPQGLTGVKEDLSIRQKQIQDFKSIFGQIDEDIPLVCLCGNHDVGNRPTQKSIEQYKTDFGADYLSFWAGGVFCIVVNSNLYADPSDAEKQYEVQHQWLVTQLKHAKERGAKHIFVFSHHPWFLFDADEGEDLPGRWLFRTRAGQRIELSNAYFHIPHCRRKPVMDLFKEYNVTAGFAGHWHKNGGKKVGDFEMVITSAVGAQAEGTEGSGFRLVKVFDNEIVHRYFPLPDLPDRVTCNTKDKYTW